MDVLFLGDIKKPSLTGFSEGIVSSIYLKQMIIKKQYKWIEKNLLPHYKK